MAIPEKKSNDFAKWHIYILYLIYNVYIITHSLNGDWSIKTSVLRISLD